MKNLSRLKTLRFFVSLLFLFQLVLMDLPVGDLQARPLRRVRRRRWAESLESSERVDVDKGSDKANNQLSEVASREGSATAELVLSDKQFGPKSPEKSEINSPSGRMAQVPRDQETDRMIRNTDPSFSDNENQFSSLPSLPVDSLEQRIARTERSPDLNAVIRGSVPYAGRRAKEDIQRPTIDLVSPGDCTILNINDPLITISYADPLPGTGIDLTSLQILLNGINYTSSFTVGRAQATYQVPSVPGLPEGENEIVVTLSDIAGNTVTETFLFGVDTVTGGEPPILGCSSFIDGVVYDSRTDLPLDSAKVTVLGIEGEVYTDSLGQYFYPALSSGEYYLTIEKSGCTYAQRKVTTVTTRDAAVEPAYLTPLDPAVTHIDSMGGTHVSSDSSVEIIFSPGAVQGEIDVQSTRYEASKELPDQLPETSFYTYALDLRPDGASFDSAVTVRMANSLGFARGTQIPIGIWNDSTLAWEDTGTMATVSADSQWVDFEVDHFSPRDCNFPICPPPPASSRRPHIDSNDTPEIEDICLTCAKDSLDMNSIITLKKGDLFMDQSLPSIHEFGFDNDLSFVYKSTSAHPSALISVVTSLDTVNTCIPMTSTFKVGVEGVMKEATFEGVPGDVRYPYLFDGKNSRGDYLDTGSYPYWIELSNNYLSDCFTGDPLTYCYADNFGGPPTDNTGIPTVEPVSLTRRVEGRIIINNQQDSPFGAGWTLSGIEQLYFDPDSTILLNDGNGSALLFKHMGVGPIFDIAVANQSGYVSILLGLKDSTFADDVRYNVGSDPQSIAVGDFNLDGNEDLVVANWGSDDVSILLGIGDGTFEQEVRYGVGVKPASIAVGDFDADGYQDLAVVNIGPWGGGGSVSILLGIGDGTFEQEVRYNGFSNIPNGVAIGDFDNDGIEDLAVSTAGLGPPWGVSILLGIGDGTFGQVELYNAGDEPISVAVSDFNDDGNDDIVVVNEWSNDISILLGIGDGTFEQEVRYGAGSSPQSVATSDFDEDGNVDLAVANPGSGDVSILMGVGDGTFEAQVRYAAGGYPYSVAVGDFDADGNKDIAVANYVSDDVSILMGNGDGTFEQEERYGAGNGPLGIAIGNFNGDYYYQEGYSVREGDFSFIRLNLDGSYTRVLKSGTEINFNEEGYQTSTVDRNGNTISYEYNEGKLDKIVYPTSQEYQFVYNPSTGHLESVIDPAGRVIQFVIDDNGDLVEIINPDSTSESYVYESHLLRYKIDALGDTTEYQYDDYARIKKVIFPTGEMRQYFPSDVYGLINDLPDTLGTPDNPAPVVRPEDVHDILVDGNGNQWIYKTNKFGGRLEFTDPLGRTTTYERNSDGLPTSITRPTGSTVTMAYDQNGNLVTYKEEFNDALTTLSYDTALNLVSSIQDPLGNLTHFIHDSNGNLKRVIDALGDTLRIDYDARGLITAITDPLGNQTHFSNDPITGNLLSIINPLEDTTRFYYSEEGNIDSTRDALGRTTKYAYDPMNRPISVVGALGDTTRYEYNDLGYITRITDSNGHLSEFFYDPIGKITKIKNPLGDSALFFYDTNRNLDTLITYNGDTIAYIYDNANQLVQKILPGNDTTSFTYSPLGKVASAIDNDSDIEFLYDPIGRIIEAKTRSGGIQPTTSLSYVYNDNNNLLAMIDMQGDTTHYTYDDLNRLVSIANPQSQTTLFGYNELSQRLNLIRDNGIETDYGYDEAGQLLGIYNILSGDTLSYYKYSYDPIGNRVQMQEIGGVHEYSYDNLNRLIQATHPIIPQEDYSYDPVGNRTSNGSIYNEANCLLEDDNFSYSYDNNGNLIQKVDKTNLDTTRYNYNAEDLLIRIDFPDGSNAQYRYDPLGRRIEKNVSGAISRYIYDNKDILGEYNGSNILMARYTHGPSFDETISMDRDGQSYFYLTDALGSIVQISDISGNIVQDYIYDSFGNIISHSGTIVNPYTYTGREYDFESGLYYYRARMYNPYIGRFLQKDPYLGLIYMSQTFNRYLYVVNNPINLTDPTGEQWIPIGIAVLGLGIGGWLHLKDKIIDMRNNMKSATINLDEAAITNDPTEGINMEKYNKYCEYLGGLGSKVGEVAKEAYMNIEMPVLAGVHADTKTETLHILIEKARDYFMNLFGRNSEKKGKGSDQ